MSEHVKLSRDELYKQVWEKPATKLAEEYGISDVMIGRHCRKMNIPKPPKGYWRKIEMGAKLKRTPLPKASKNTIENVFFTPSTKNETVDISLADQEAVDAADLPENRIQIALDFEKAHPLVLRTKAYIDTANVDDAGVIFIPKGKGYLSLSVSRSHSTRALLIMDALFKSFEKQGYEVLVSKDNWGEATQIRSGEQFVEISVKERIKRLPRQLTDVEKKKPPYLLNIPEEYQSTGKLSIKINDRFSNSAIWNDRKDDSIENRLGSVRRHIIGVIQKLVEEKRRRDEILQREKEHRESIADEKRRREKLESDAAQWQKSRNICDYLKAFEAKMIENDGEIDPQCEKATWLKWAYEYAISLDPLNQQSKNE